MAQAFERMGIVCVKAGDYFQREEASKAGGMVAQVFNPTTQQAEAGGTMSLRLTWSP